MFFLTWPIKSANRLNYLTLGLEIREDFTTRYGHIIKDLKDNDDWSLRRQSLENLYSRAKFSDLHHSGFKGYFARKYCLPLLRDEVFRCRYTALSIIGRLIPFHGMEKLLGPIKELFEDYDYEVLKKATVVYFSLRKKIKSESGRDCLCEFI